MDKDYKKKTRNKIRKKIIKDKEQDDGKELK